MSPAVNFPECSRDYLMFYLYCRTFSQSAVYGPPPAEYSYEAGRMYRRFGTGRLALIIG